MECMFCDTAREKHSPAELAECQAMGANAGSLGLALASGWDPDY
jgi:hypothetical protein